MNKIFKFYTFFLLVIIVASCSKKGASGTESLVSKNAKIVVAINVQQFMDKMAKNGFTIDSNEGFLKSLEDSSYKSVPFFWKESSKVGIDFSQPFVISMGPNESSLKNNKGIMQFTFAISNKDSFETYLQKQKKGIEIEKGTISFANDGDDMIIGYNNRFVVAVQEIELEEKRILGNSPDSNNTSKEQKLAIQKEWIKAAMRTPAGKSIVSNKHYSKLASKGNDIKIWADQEYVVENMNDESQSTQMVTRMFKDLFKGSSTTTLLNFDNGKVNALNHMYFSEEASKIIKSSPSQQMDLRLLNNFPGSTLNVLAGFSLSPNMIKDLATYMKLDGLMNAAFAQINFSDKEVFDAFSGDLLMAVSDVKPNTNSTNSSNVNLGIMFNIKNKASVEKLLSIPDIAKVVKNEGTFYTIDNGAATVASKNKMFLYMNDKVAIISPNQQLASNYISGTSKNNFSNNELNNFQGKTSGYYYNIASFGDILSKTNLPDIPMIGNPKLFIQDFMKIFLNAQMSCGQFKNDYFESSGSLTLNNDKVNSLAYMIRSGYSAMVAVKKKAILDPNEIDISANGSEFEDDEIKPRQVK